MDDLLILEQRKKRTLRFSVATFFFVAGLCFASWASRIADIQSTLHLNNAELGSVLLGLPVGLLLSLPFAGILVARFGSRNVVLSAAFSYALLLPLLGLTISGWQLMLGLFLYGISGNILNISVNTQAVGAEYIFGRSIMASFHGIWSLAGFAGAALGALFISLHFLPYQHFLIIAATASFLIIRASSNLIPLDVNSSEQRPVFSLPDKSLINLGFIAFCSMICEGTMFDWSSVYFKRVIRPSNDLIAAGYTAFMCTMALGRFAADHLASKYGKRRVLQLSGVLTAAGLLLAITAPYFFPAIAGFLLVGAGVSSVVPFVYSIAGKSKTLSSGVALAAVSTIGYFGFLVGPPVIGFIAQIVNLRVSFCVIAILGIGITFLARKTIIA
ncbi:MAG TPA: MFS transporter [Puia sp.]|nr:MFS transporter [Puia sp.]